MNATAKFTERRTDMAMNVGTSWRTWLKHNAMLAFVAEEVWALSTEPFSWVAASDWIDTTAGNGMAVDEYGQEMDRADTEFWSQHCSPGILCFQATKSHKPVTVMMFELDPYTYEVLVEQLGYQLDRLGFNVGDDHLDRFEWIGQSEFGQQITVTAIRGSGHTAPVDHIARAHAVLVLNDPNNVDRWAVRDGFATEIMGRGTNMLRMFHAIGANANGVKRMSRDYRARWFRFVDAEIFALNANHDLILCRLVQDSHQWAYMIRTSSGWRHKAERIFKRSFKDWGHGLDFAWHRGNAEQFDAITKKLFLTSSEYQYEESVGETLCLF
jgi:hypothetical protein